MSSQTLAEKIVQAHMTAGPDRPVRAGDVVSLRPRHIMTHDNTSAVRSKFRALGAARILDPRQPVWPMDHDVQNHSPENLAKYAAIEAFAREQGHEAPSVRLARDGNGYVVSDGRHRVAAALAAGFRFIEAEVRPIGSMRRLVIGVATWATGSRCDRGRDIDAACGQLAGRVQDRTKRRIRIHNAAAVTPAH